MSDDTGMLTEFEFDALDKLRFLDFHKGGRCDWMSSAFTIDEQDWAPYQTLIDQGLMEVQPDSNKEFWQVRITENGAMVHKLLREAS